MSGERFGAVGRGVLDALLTCEQAAGHVGPHVQGRTYWDVLPVGAEPADEDRSVRRIILAAALKGMYGHVGGRAADWLADADALLAGPLQRLVRDHQAVERCAALADEFDSNANWREWGVGRRIRRALDGEP